MILNLYAVLDEKARAFRHMFFLKTHDEAIRHFGIAARDEKTMVNQYPQDFSLYFCGSFDDETGRIESVAPIIFLSRASDFGTLNSINSVPAQPAQLPKEVVQ